MFPLSTAGSSSSPDQSNIGVFHFRSTNLQVHGRGSIYRSAFGSVGFILGLIVNCLRTVQSACPRFPILAFTKGRGIFTECVFIFFGGGVYFQQILLLLLFCFYCFFCIVFAFTDLLLLLLFVFCCFSSALCLLLLIYYIAFAVCLLFCFFAQLAHTRVSYIL